jgi:hypothetical protein
MNGLAWIDANGEQVKADRAETGKDTKQQIKELQEESTKVARGQ